MANFLLEMAQNQELPLRYLSKPTHTVAIWTFPFHQNPVKKSDDFPDLTLAQYNLKK